MRSHLSFSVASGADDRFGSLAIARIEPSSIPVMFNNSVFHDC